MGNEFNIERFREAVAQRRIRWQLHALERMLERRIPRSEVLEAVTHGEIIERYAADTPFPSCLIAHVAGQPLHVVAAIDQGTGIAHIITAYRPDRERFERDYRTRRRPL
jgi:hypothetical protein